MHFDLDLLVKLLVKLLRELSVPCCRFVLFDELSYVNLASLF